MISCIPYGFQIKKNLSREANLAVHQLHVLEIMTSQFWLPYWKMIYTKLLNYKQNIIKLSITLNNNVLRSEISHWWANIQKFMISTIPTRINLSLFRSAKISSEAVNFSQAMTCNSHITFTYEKRGKNTIVARAHLT